MKCTVYGKICRQTDLPQILARVSNALTVTVAVLGLLVHLGGRLIHHLTRAVIVFVYLFVCVDLAEERVEVGTFSVKQNHENEM
jgi:hypothetical protein